MGRDILRNQGHTREVILSTHTYRQPITVTTLSRRRPERGRRTSGTVGTQSKVEKIGRAKKEAWWWYPCRCLGREASANGTGRILAAITTISPQVQCYKGTLDGSRYAVIVNVESVPFGCSTGSCARPCDRSTTVVGTAVVLVQYCGFLFW